MVMAENTRIRVSILKSGFKNYEIAKQMGITQFHLSRLLRTKLSKDNQDRILKAIQELTDRKAVQDGRTTTTN